MVKRLLINRRHPRRRGIGVTTVVVLVDLKESVRPNDYERPTWSPMSRRYRTFPRFENGETTGWMACSVQMASRPTGTS